MLNGQHTEEEEADEDASASFLEFLPCAELSRKTGLGRRFIVTLYDQGHVRRRQAGNGWHYCLTDCEEYKEKTATPGSKGGTRRTEYETELQTLVNGYKELLGLQNAALKHAQQHERELFQAFTGPLKVVTDAMQGQVTQLTERANAGDTARVDFIVATEAMLRDNRAEQAERERAEATRAMRLTMWGDMKKAAPHVWAQIQETLGFDAETLARAKAGQALKEKLDEQKVAALFAFDFLSDEEKDLLCKAFGYDRAGLEKMAADAGASEVVGEEVPPEKSEASSAET